MFSMPVAVRQVMLALHAGGYEAFLVGGCVRDLLMGSVPKDWDITTSATPSDMKEIFSDFKLIETGLKHGTITVLINGEPLEITTFRVDGKSSDHRRPDTVSFTKSLQEDIVRRDFTMNAIAYSLDTGLIDFVGGIQDIKSGIIRCVGDPDLRFQEDGLRMLRALRFAAVLGFDIDAKTAESIHTNKRLLENISAERIYAEMTRMLTGREVGKVLRQYADVLCVMIPEFTPMIGFAQHNQHHCFDVWQHTVAVVENSLPVPLLRWAALLHDIGKPACFTLDANGVGHFYGHAAIGREMADEIMRRLKFDNKTRERILLLIAHHDTPIPCDEKTIKRYLNRFGAEVLFEIIALARADNLGQSEAFRHRQTEYDALETLVHEILHKQPCVSLKDMAINGNDLLELGYRGKEIGNALTLLLEAVIEGYAANEKQELLSYLKKQIDINEDRE